MPNRRLKNEESAAKYGVELAFFLLTYDKYAPIEKPRSPCLSCVLLRFLSGRGVNEVQNTALNLRFSCSRSKATIYCVSKFAICIANLFTVPMRWDKKYNKNNSTKVRSIYGIKR